LELYNSVSAGPESLQLLDSGECIFLACGHRSCANLLVLDRRGQVLQQRQVAPQPDGVTSAGSTAPLLQCCLVSASDRHFLVLLTHRSAQFFDADGTALLLCHTLKGAAASESLPLRGVCGLAEAGLLCVGTASGELLIFDCPPGAAPVSHRGTQAVTSGSSGPAASVNTLTSLEASPIGSGGFAAGFADGAVCVGLISGGKVRLLSRVLSNQDGWPVNAFGLFNEGEFLLAGCGDGGLRAFQCKGMELVAEIGAHARLITGLDVCDKTGLMVTCSEDTSFRAWQLSDEGGNLLIKHLSCTVVPNQMLQGCAFLQSDRRLLTVAFESNEIRVFARK
ncbi:hypothetical protein BOX15_Mlig003626g1, partial [Macrostomum lignano]